MVPYVQRESYLQQLIDRRDNGDIKIITGPRRSGKSWLLNRIYKDYLLLSGIPQENIIIVSFDIDEEENGDLTNRQALKSYLSTAASHQVMNLIMSFSTKCRKLKASKNW